MATGGKCFEGWEFDNRLLMSVLEKADFTPSALELSVEMESQYALLTFGLLLL
jgi:hypothetical protein